MQTCGGSSVNSLNQPMNKNRVAHDLSCHDALVSLLYQSVNDDTSLCMFVLVSTYFWFIHRWIVEIPAQGQPGQKSKYCSHCVNNKIWLNPDALKLCSIPNTLYRMHIRFVYIYFLPSTMLIRYFLSITKHILRKHLRCCMALRRRWPFLIPDIAWNHLGSSTCWVSSSLIQNTTKT